MLGEDLLELAREPSSEKRSALLRRITDLFYDGVTERNVSENALFEEVVLRVLKDVDVAGRSACRKASPTMRFCRAVSSSRSLSTTSPWRARCWSARLSWPTRTWCV